MLVPFRFGLGDSTKELQLGDSVVRAGTCMRLSFLLWGEPGRVQRGALGAFFSAGCESRAPSKQRLNQTFRRAGSLCGRLRAGIGGRRRWEGRVRAAAVSSAATCAGGEAEFGVAVG